jgi:multidrug efflux system membrane fusion protein
MDRPQDRATGSVAQPVRADAPRDVPPPYAPVVPGSVPPPRRAGGRRKGLRWLIIVAILLALIVVVWRVFGPPAGGGRHARAEPPQPVGVARIGTGDVHVVMTGLGTVTPMATITVQTQISGQLMSVGFKEGQLVQKGDFLAQIDPRPYQVTLEQAQGAFAHDTALLAQAKSDLARYIALNRQDSIAKQQVTDQQFLVQQDQGLVIEDQANIDSAKLNLTYCHIVAPVSGRVGLRLVDPGNYVQTSSATGLVVITELQPISVVFVLPEDDIPGIAQEMNAGQTLAVGAYDRTNARQLAAGTLLTVDNTVDTTTGTVKLRASFPNTDHALFPNQFVNARLLLKTLTGVIEAPSAAVQHGAPGSFVYLVKPDGTVGVQVIKTGVTDGDNVQVLSGLKPGDSVVVDGADRLKDGAHVKVSPDAGDQAATPNNGPGAPPGEQPANATPVPAQSGQPPNGNPQGSDPQNANAQKHHRRHQPTPQTGQ